MPFIAFLGCDGSGKSAAISVLSQALRDQGLKTICGHWRPQALDRSNQAIAMSADDPHGQVPRGLFSSVLKLGWLWLNWWLGWFRFLKGWAASGVVLFDRYHADLLVDPMRYRYGGLMGLARLASRWMPQPDLVIFLDAPPEVLLNRKQEVGYNALLTARKKYLRLCETHPRFHIVDASRPLDQVIAEVMELIARFHGPLSPDHLAPL